MCQSKVTHGLVQPFNRLYNGSWVFAVLNAQVSIIFMTFKKNRYTFGKNRCILFGIFDVQRPVLEGFLPAFCN